MSNGSNPLIGNGGGGNGNPLVPSAQQLAPNNPFAQAAAPPNPFDHTNISRAHISLALHGLDQDTLIKKRDNVGKELVKLAQVMNDPNPNRQEMVDYIHQLTQDDQVTVQEATALIGSLPKDAAQIHQWSKMMFTILMHVGVHAEAAFPRELFPGKADEQTAPEAQEPAVPAAEDQALPPNLGQPS